MFVLVGSGTLNVQGTIVIPFPIGPFETKEEALNFFQDNGIRVWGSYEAHELSVPNRGELFRKAMNRSG